MKKYVIDLVMNVGKKKILIPHEPRIYGLSTTEHWTENPSEKKAKFLQEEICKHETCS